MDRPGTLLATVVETSEAVGATRSRKAKVAALAEMLRRLSEPEVVPTVGFLVGQARQGRIGVGGRTAYGVEAAPAEAPSLTVLDLDATLTELMGTTGPGSTARRNQLLADLYQRATAEEVDFIRRLLVGELRQGALAGIMTEAVAAAAEVPLPLVRRAAMLSGDLGRTARLALHDGTDALEAVGLTVLNPIEPMLAATAEDVADAIARTGPASVEWKLDGARVQVHRDGAEVRIYTRNLNDVTDRLPGVAKVVRAMPAEQVVLDGEVLGVDDDARPQAFQDTMSAFGRDQPGAADGLLVRFFDILHRDGSDLIDEPLSARQAHLDEVAGALVVPRTVTDDLTEAAAVLEVALAEGHEGVMVKAVDSTYEAGRRGGAWRKVKPVHTLDLVVLAAEWGHGRRKGWLSNLWLGARDPGGGFVMVGKTFKGMPDRAGQRGCRGRQGRARRHTPGRR